jgi:hypothetical protein
MMFLRKLLVLILLTFGFPSWSIEATDQWSYTNVMFQTIFGALGIVVLGMNYISGSLYYGKEERDVQQYLHNHLDELEQASFDQQNLYNYTAKYEELFNALMNGEIPMKAANDIQDPPVQDTP